jgi:hypothetical protein
LLQLIPCGLELDFRTLVVEAVHPGVLNEDVKTVHEGARRGRSSLVRCAGVGDTETPIPLRSKVELSNKKVKTKR